MLLLPDGLGLEVVLILASLWASLFLPDPVRYLTDLLFLVHTSSFVF